MCDLAVLFGDLEAAARRGDFETALMGSPLGAVCLHGHPLGFRVARISRGPVALRLHLWTGASTEQPGYEAHDHMFDLTSHVVRGIIRQQTFEFVSDPGGVQAIYSVAYEDGQSVIVRTEQRGRLVRTGDERFDPGVTYTLSAGDLHIAERQSEEAAITLALTTSRLDQAMTVGPWDGSLELQASRRKLDDRPLRDLGLDLALLV